MSTAQGRGQPGSIMRWWVHTSMSSSSKIDSTCASAQRLARSLLTCGSCTMARDWGREGSRNSKKISSKAEEAVCLGDAQWGGGRRARRNDGRVEG
eukprot:358497-Chlamydomonas_euryale.AAC.3